MICSGVLVQSWRGCRATKEQQRAATATLLGRPGLQDARLMGIDLNALLSCHVEGVDECPPLPIRGRPVVPGEEDHVVERHGPPQPSKPNERVSVD